MIGYIRRDEPLLIWTGHAMLDAVLSLPQNAEAIVILLGLGGTFHHERIRSVAREFQDQGFATLIADVLTADEQQFDARTGHFRVDTPFLSSRIRDIVEWASTQEMTGGLPAALFAGSSTASACIDAADDLSLFAMALIGPRYESIRDQISGIDTPTLIVFDHPPSLVQLAEISAAQMVNSVMTVPGISSLLENDLAADVAARESLNWFSEHVPAATLA